MGAWGLLAATLLSAGAPDADAALSAASSASRAEDAAVVRWRALAVAGDAEAQYRLAQALRLGRGAPRDVGQATSWLARAAAQGHGRAIAGYALLLHERGERQAALPWLARAADAGDPAAQYVLGTMLFNGDLVAVDRVRAHAYMTRAAAAGLAPAAANLRQMEALLPPDRPVAPAPAPRPARPAAGKPPPPTRGWRVQLGAFADTAAARRAWRELREKLPKLVRGTPVLRQAGEIVRLRSPILADRAAAAALCVRVRAVGGDCLPIAP